MYNRKLQFHFTGIGGTGMSGIAEVLINLGFKVSGSDISRGTTVSRLERLGATVYTGHAAENVPSETSLVVYSSAVTHSNPELVEAARRGLPVIRRAEVLAELMRLKFGVAVAGSHGKTTSTSMIGSVLVRGGLDPTVIIGGQVKSMESGGHLGTGEYLVAETDESDRSFLLLKPTIAVVTNIDAEHMNAYSSLRDLEESFETFLNAVPFYGLGVLCIDDPRVRSLAGQFRGRKVTYGLSPDAQIRAENIVVGRGTTSYTARWGVGSEAQSMDVTIALPGIHLAVNSLSAIAVGLEFGLEPSVIREGLADFSGVKRRIEVVGEARGVTIINDYAHHPTEIKATLAAIRTGWQIGESSKLHVVFQPHRYSRTKDCFVEFLSSFRDADSLCLCDIYAASEQPIEGISGISLCEAIPHGNKSFAESPRGHLETLLSIVQPGDVVACLGAGSVGTFAEELPGLIDSGFAGGFPRAA